MKRPPPPTPKDSDDSDKPVVKKPRPPKQERSFSPVEKRTTRGKKINYQEIIGSDSDDVRTEMHCVQQRANYFVPSAQAKPYKAEKSNY